MTESASSVLLSTSRISALRRSAHWEIRTAAVLDQQASSNHSERRKQMRIGDQTGKVKRVNAASLRSTAASGSRISIFAAGRSIRVLCLMCMTVLLLTGCKSRASELRLQGISELEKGKYEDAIKTLDEALQESNGKISREQFDILLYRAEAEYMTGDYDAGLAAQQTRDEKISALDMNSETYTFEDLMLISKIILYCV